MFFEYIDLQLPELVHDMGTKEALIRCKICREV
jgi:hypothetical protein